MREFKFKKWRYKRNLRNLFKRKKYTEFIGKRNKPLVSLRGLDVRIGKWQILSWPIGMGWLLNYGYWPNTRNPMFKFWNFLFIEVRYFGAFNKKKVCKKCGQELPESDVVDK